MIKDKNYRLRLKHSNYHFLLVAAPADTTHHTYKLRSFLTILAFLVLCCQCISQILMHATILIYDSSLLTYYTIFLSDTRISLSIEYYSRKVMLRRLNNGKNNKDFKS